MSDDVLLPICRTSLKDERVTEAWMADLRLVASLIAAGRNSDRRVLEHAVTLLAGCLGQLPQHNPTHLPFGYAGPVVRSHAWMDRDSLEQTAKQLVGLIWADADSEDVACRVTESVSEAIRLGFMDQQKYDAWRPGMRPGSGWRAAVMATTLGMTKARAGLDNSPLPGKKAGQISSPAGVQRHRQAAQTAEYFNWATQAELCRAVVRVIGDGAEADGYGESASDRAPDKATISRAVQSGQLQSNGQSGRACRVSVDGFVRWIAKRCKSLDSSEVRQIEDAIISEIRNRKP